MAGRPNELEFKVAADPDEGQVADDSVVLAERPPKLSEVLVESESGMRLAAKGRMARVRA